MIYHSKTTKSALQSDSQAGVTLMLAVLILAAVTAVAFSLATVVFIEIRTSGDVLKTEPNVYATIGVTEEALFQYKRFIPTSNGFNVPGCTPASVCNINNVTLQMLGTQPIAYDDSPKIQVVPSRTKVSLPMYMANDFSKQYNSVQVDMLPIGSGVNLQVSLIRTDINNNVTTASIGSISEGGSNFVYSNMDTGQYDLVLDNTGNSADVTVSITTVRNNKPIGDPDGLPFVGQAVLRIMANYLGLTRTYQVQIPIP